MFWKIFFLNKWGHLLLLHLMMRTIKKPDVPPFDGFQ